jgi:hypothetical protein
MTLPPEYPKQTRARSTVAQITDDKRSGVAARPKKGVPDNPQDAQGSVARRAALAELRSAPGITGSRS